MDDLTQEEINAIMKAAQPSGADAEEEAAPPPAQAASPPPGAAAAEQVTQGIAGGGGVAATQVQMETFQSAPGAPAAAPISAGSINFLLDVPLDVAVELGRTKIAMKDMLQLGPGSVVELDKLIGEPVDILVNERLIAKGEVVVFDESFGVRITDIINTEDRLKSLG